MNLIWDFIRAASPWGAMGLLLAIFFVQSAVKKKKGKKQDGDYGTEGMCLGMCFGTALGVMFIVMSLGCRYGAELREGKE